MPAPPGSPESIPTTVFNLDLTLAVDARSDIAFDVADAGLRPVAPEDELQRFSFQELHKSFIRWTRGQTPEDLQPLFDHIRETAGDRVPRWAGIVAARESLPAYGREHELMLVSKMIPHEIVEAYADGLETEWGVSIDVRAGAELSTYSDGTYRGRDEWLDKNSVFLTLMRQEGRTFEVVADSFRDGQPGLRKARHPVMANPESTLSDIRMGDFDTIYADDEEPDVVKLQKAGESSVVTFDLEYADQVDDFIEAFYRPSLHRG